MTPFTAYRNAFTGKAHQTKTGCLREEFAHLRRDVVSCCEALIVLPSVSLQTQFSRLLVKIRALYDKGAEYHEAVCPGDGVPAVVVEDLDALPLRERVQMLRDSGAALTPLQQSWLLSVVVELIDSRDEVDSVVEELRSALSAHSELSGDE